MLSKTERHDLVSDLVRRRTIRNQGDLRDALVAAGAEVTQSTLSRDLVELEVHKVDGRYSLPVPAAAVATALDLSSVVSGWVTCGPHLIVVETSIGQAQAVAVAIDSHSDRSIAGTVAGDDTIFVATRTSKLQVVALRRLRTWFGKRS